jgi:hypothetical protein
MRGFHIALCSVALLACTQVPLVIAPAPSDFDRALSHARRNVDAGNYWAADRLLEEFARTHPDTREAREIAFWKAAYLVDPANDRGSLSAGIATSPAGATDTVVVVSRSRDEEIAALKEQLAKSKEELAKVSAELERIKKRLANPSN